MNELQESCCRGECYPPAPLEGFSTLLQNLKVSAESVASPPRILFAAGASGGGKTTVTCAVLQAFHQRGLAAASFKCGPDFVDPLFHSSAIGVPSRNLDLFLSDANTLRFLLCKNAAEDISVLEGVMGYYDGLALTQEASTYAIARETQTPVVLVVNCRGMAASILALIQGFLTYEEDNQIVGVILNQLPPSLYPALKEKIEARFAVKVYGYLPRLPYCSLESRQLGLIPASEVENLKEKLQRLAEQAEKTVDLAGLLALGMSAKPLSYTPPALPPRLKKEVKIGMARDKAFAFYYEDNLQILRDLGARLIASSPMEDRALPDGLDGLILGGGYPEVFAEALSSNVAMRESIKMALASGLPCLAECGGFQYLQQSIEGMDGKIYPLVGALPSRSFKTTSLRRFGYSRMTANRNNLLCQKGDSIPVHEFHRWDSIDTGDTFTAKKASNGLSWDCVISDENLFAGYPHLYFYSNPEMAARFLCRCGEHNFSGG